MIKTGNFSTELRRFIVLFKFAGIAPFASRSCEKWLLYLYSFILFIIIGILFVSRFYLTATDNEDDTNLSSIVENLVLSCILFTHALIIVQAFIYRHEQLMILQQFNAIDLLFINKLFTGVRYKQIRQKYTIKIGTIFTMLFTLKVFFITFILVNSLDVRYWLYCVLSVISIRVRCLQNMFYVDSIRDRIEIINKKLEEIIEGRADQLNMILFIDRFPNDKRGANKRSIYDELLTMKQVYGKIWDITNLINDCFGWSLLAVTTQSFIEFTSNGYWLFLSLERILPLITAVYPICSIIPIVLMLSILAHSCYSCGQSGLRTGGLLHKIEKDVDSGLHNALVREFSLQIIHEPITISANGFFTINFTLLGSMAAATVTYLVILIQFQLSEKNKVSNTTTTP